MGRRCDRRKLHAARIDDCRLYGNALRRGALIDHRGLDVDRGGSGRDRGRGHVGSPLVNMHRANGDDPHVPVDSRPGVIPCAGLERIIDLHRDHVVRGAEVRLRGDFVAKRYVAIGTIAKGRAVDIHGAVGHHAVEFNENAAALHAAREGEMLPVPADSRRRPCSVSGGLFGCGERSFDAPIMRDAQRAPCGVSECCLVGPCRVAQVEEPAGIERHDGANCGGGLCRTRVLEKNGDAVAGFFIPQQCLGVVPGFACHQ